MAAAELFEVEVVYALPDRQRTLAVKVVEGTSVAEAIRQSGILGEYPEGAPEDRTGV